LLKGEKMNQKMLILGLALILLGIILSINVNAYFIDSELSFNADCLNVSYKNFNLINNTNTRQHYILSASGLNASWLNINGKNLNVFPFEFYLNSGEKKPITLFVLPNCSAKGFYTLNLNVREGSNEFIETIKVNVNETKNVLMNASEKTILLEKCSERIIEITLKNPTQLNERINLTIENYPLELVSFSENNIFLEKNSEKKIKAKIKAECNAREENKTIKLIALIEKTSIKKEEELNIKIIENKNNYVNKETSNENNEEKKPIALILLTENNSWLLLLIFLLLIFIILYYLYAKRLIPTNAEIEAEKRTLALIKKMES